MASTDDIDWEDVDFTSPNPPEDAELTTLDMSALDNVEVEIPAKIDIPPRQINRKADLTAKEQEIIKSLEAEDEEDLNDVMTDRKKLMKRLQEDPEFDKRYKKAEQAYIAKIRGEKAPADAIPDDEMYRQAQVIVERMHNKSTSSKKETQEVDDIDPHGLSRFGKVTDEVPEDPEINLEELMRNTSGGPIIYIANVKNLIINVRK
jgi:hypothetical protein